MGNNRVEDVALPAEETDAASKYYVDSIFPARFIGLGIQMAPLKI